MLDAFSPGGSGPQRTFTLEMRLSNSRPALGFTGAIALEGVRVRHLGPASADPLEADLTGTARWIDSGVSPVRDDVLVFSFHTLAGFADDTGWLPSGNDVPVMRFDGVCLTFDTPAGEHPMTLEYGEIVDAETALAVLPALESTVLTIAADVSRPLSPCPPEPPAPQGTMTLESTAARPGDRFSVSLIIWAPGPVEGYSFSDDFDEELLDGIAVLPEWERPDGLPYDFQFYEINDLDLTPGNGGVDEGFVIGAAVFEFDGLPSALMPAETDNEALQFEFFVPPDVTAPGTQVRSLDGGQASDRPGPTNNVLTVNGTGIDLDLVDATIVFEEAPPARFIRGDCNGDGQVAGRVTDAVFLLNHNFRGGSRPPCLAACDANGDGRVTGSVTDAV